MKKKENALSALRAVFPTPEALALFSKNIDNKKIFESFIAFAAVNGLIKTEDEKALQAFVRQHSRSEFDLTPPSHLTFEELLKKKEEILKIGFSGRALTDHVNALIAEYRIELPKVSNAMLTRLKKEPADTIHKQNVLRSLAFWLGHERSELGPLWNFETLFKLCGERKPSENHREGVRIGFALYSRGEVIDHDIVGWLKKALKSYIEQSAGHFQYGRWGKVRSHDITTLYVDFPKEEEAGAPASYRQCLRSAVSLAHQLAVRWALSKYCTKSRFLSIGIATGEYANLDNYLLPILNAKLPGDPVIRVTDYVRQCLLINDTRAILCERPTETALFNGEALAIWWIAALWSTLYFDFVPDLLEDQILKNNRNSIETLNRLLWSSPDDRPNPAETDEPNAVTTFFKFPHNSLLGVEIAKTLYYRRRFWEALEILRIVLSIDPTHLIARALRMVIFRNLALDAPSFPISEDLFKQSEQEALYIEEHCTGQSEDFYCEYAVTYLAKAMSALRYMREGRGIVSGHPDIQKLKQVVFSAFDRADDLFEKGMTVSPSGIRSAYLLNSVRVLEAILKNDDRLFTDPQKPIDGPLDVVRQPSRDFQWQLGFSREDIPPEEEFDFKLRLTIQKFKIHDDSISLQNYRPTTYFCHIVSLWDFSPVRTVGLAKRAFQFLEEAREIAKAMEKDDLCIYSFTRTYGEMMPAGEFIRHITASLQMIESQVGKDLSDRDDQEIIDPVGDLSSMLMTLNF
jgi:tetratricopeptide (TPR) repeat protein